MSATASNNRRDLAHRHTDGIDVTMFWKEGTKRVTIGVLDSKSGDALEFEIDGSLALDAFNHPYAYAAARRVPSRPPSGVVVTS